MQLRLEIHDFWQKKPKEGDHIILAHPCTTYAGVVTSVTEFSVAFRAYHRNDDCICLDPAKGAWWAHIPYHEAFREAGCDPVGQDRFCALPKGKPQGEGE